MKKLLIGIIALLLLSSCSEADKWAWRPAGSVKIETTDDGVKYYLSTFGNIEWVDFVEFCVTLKEKHPDKTIIIDAENTDCITFTIKNFSGINIVEEE